MVECLAKAGVLNCLFEYVVKSVTSAPLSKYKIP